MPDKLEQTLVLEAIEIIAEFLLHSSDVLCGSKGGRRLQHILRELRRNNPKPVPLATESDRDVLITRSVDLSVTDDTTLGHLATQRGVTRDYLIRAAVSSMLEDYRTQPSEQPTTP
jgi:hypothetical protein